MTLDRSREIRAGQDDDGSAIRGILCGLLGEALFLAAIFGAAFLIHKVFHWL